MAQTDRWEPDGQLVSSYLAGPRPGFKLAPPDRAWVVAGLTLAGKTADDIAMRLGCSLRLVRTIRSEPLTQVCMFYQREVAAFEDELRLAGSDHRSLAEQLAVTEAELDRVKSQLARFIGRVAFPKCGHPMDRYNTYEWTDSKGRTKRSCRRCHRERMAETRKTGKNTPLNDEIRDVPTEVGTS